MYRAIAFVAILLVAFYVITFLRMRKRRRALEQSYIEKSRERRRRLHHDRSSQDDALFDSVSAPAEKTDYIDKEEFLENIRKEASGESTERTGPRKRHFVF